jgi:hypothetical protein
MLMRTIKDVAVFLTRTVPLLFVMGCACHIIHLAASKAA